MDRGLDHKMVDKEPLHRRRLAMDFLVHSSSEAVAYSPFEAVVYSPSEAVAYSEAEAYSEAVAYSEAEVCSPCEVVDLPSSEAADPSVEVVDHNLRMMEILPRV